MHRPAWMFVVLLSTVLAGCLESGNDLSDPSAAGGGLNPWEAGLGTYADTPDVAVRRSADDRRSDLSPSDDPRFAAFDATVEAIMARYDIPAAQVALLHDGKLRYERGYGHVDEAETTPTDVTTLFRLGSVTKPMTLAVVALQIEQGMYDWDDPVFCIQPDAAEDCLLPIEPHPDRPVIDQRLRDITVAQLADHTGGWGRPADVFIYGDGINLAAATLGIDNPPPAWRLAQYMLGEELAYEPGTTLEYCNMCYHMLGLIAEAQSGVTLPALYDAYLFRPLEVVGDIEPGFTRPEDRNPRETDYPCDGEFSEWGNAYEPGVPVCPSDGAVPMETILSMGGLIGTASAVGVVFDAYDSEFNNIYGPFHYDGHTGGIPGGASWTEEWTDDHGVIGKVQYVFLFNKAGFDDPLVEHSTIYDFRLAVQTLAWMWGATEAT